MALTFDRTEANQKVDEAFALAATASQLPSKWIQISREIWAFTSKTWTPALGTVLLAKSLNSQVDVDSIKIQPDNPRSFSLRSLGHEVLVPASRRLGFSIRATGREPLNNQPFFRYLRVSTIDRVRNHRELEFYKSILTELRPLSEEESTAALAAFLFVGIGEQQRRDSLRDLEGDLEPSQLVAVLNEMLGLARGGPWVTQAFGAVLLEYFSSTVITRRLNDPSRDFPGDVQGLDSEGNVNIALEARNKKVSKSDLVAFASACSTANIPRALMLVFGGFHEAFDREKMAIYAWRNFDVSLRIIDRPEDAVSELLTWSRWTTAEIMSTVAERFSARLDEIEAPLEVRGVLATHLARQDIKSY